MNEEIVCGPGDKVCAGNPPKMLTMCPNHAEVMAADHTRRMGIPDLQYTSEHLATVEGKERLINDILFNLKARPTKALLIRIIP